MQARHLQILTAAVALAATSGHAQSIIAGGFEMPPPPAGGFTNYVTGSTLIPGWTVPGPGGISVVGSTFEQSRSNFVSHDATSSSGRTESNSNGRSGVRQSAASTPDTSSDATLRAGNVLDLTGILAASSLLVQAIRSDGVGPTTQPWQQPTTSLITNSLDNVTIVGSGTGAPETVPEPTSLALLGTGLIGLVPVLRRHR